jgi:hypothetical protein
MIAPAGGAADAPSAHTTDDEAGVPRDDWAGAGRLGMGMGV